MEQWVAVFGIASTITTDRGAQFELKIFTKLANVLGTNRIRSTAYFPQVNGQVERFHRQLKAVLVAHGDPTKRSEVLPLVTLDIRTAVKANAQKNTSPPQ